MGKKPTQQQIAPSGGERRRLEHVKSNLQSLQKHVWRAHIILEFGSGCGLVETMLRTGISKPGAGGVASSPMALTGFFGSPPVRREGNRSVRKRRRHDRPSDVATSVAWTALDGAGAGK